MNAIVVVFTSAPDAQPSIEHPAAPQVVDVWQQRTESDNTRAGFQPTSNRAQPVLPLWTWFIENPRRCGA